MNIANIPIPSPAIVGSENPASGNPEGVVATLVGLGDAVVVKVGVTLVLPVGDGDSVVVAVG